MFEIFDHFFVINFSISGEIVLEEAIFKTKFNEK